MTPDTGDSPRPVPAARDPLPWHEAAWNRVQSARTAGRLPHALLLQGVSGLGKRQFADLLAMSLFCAAPDRRGLPCGTCRGCRQFSVGAHPDLVVIEPEESGKQIRIEAVRDLMGWEELTSHAAGHKVVVVEPADAMNPSAANALLKTLEEPAGQTLMLLISAHPSRLPATIRSRCQRVAFSPPSRDAAMAWLTARGVGTDPDLLYGLSAGSPLKALALADPDILAERHRVLEELLDLLAGRQDPVAVAGRWHRLNLPRILEWLAGWAIDMVRLQTMRSPPMLFNPDQAERLRRVGAEVPSGRLHALVQRTLRTAGSAGGQLNAHLLLEGLLLEWAAGAGATPARRSPGKPDRP